jgi:hypothetical protein
MCAPCSGPKIDGGPWTLPSSRPSALLYLFVLPASQEWGGNGDCPVCVCVCVCVCTVVIFILQAVSKTYAHILLITHVAKLSRRLLIKWYSFGFVHRAVVKCTDVSEKHNACVFKVIALHNRHIFLVNSAPTWTHCYPEEVGSISLRNVATFNPYTIQTPKPRPRCQARHMIFEIAKLLNTKITAFWDTTPWNLADIVSTDVSHKTYASVFRSAGRRTGTGATKGPTEGLSLTI